MDDAEIVALYWQRSEAAIAETEAKYGAYCRAIAWQLLCSREDTEECVDDAWLAAWNAMPDKRPAHLSPFLGRITRNLALNRLDKRHSLRRGGGVLPLCLEELSGCIPGGSSPEEALEARELAERLRRFVDQLPKAERRVFLGRYFYFLSLEEIAARLGYHPGKVKSMLYRSRQKLLRCLQEEGFV